MITKIRLYIGKIAISPLKFKIFLSFALLPLMIALCLVYVKGNKISEKEQMIEELYTKALKTKKIRGAQKTYFERLKNGNPSFIKEQVEPSVLLKNEIKEIDNYLSSEPFKENVQLKNRLSFLKSGINNLAFKTEKTSQEEKKENGQIIASEEKQINSIEATFDDLLSILSLIESVPINNFIPIDNTPIMLIKRIEISKSKNANLSINNLSIIKKDFVKGQD